MGILEIPKSPSYCLTDKVKRRLLWNPFPHVFLLSLIALQAPECMWFVFYHGLNGLDESEPLNF